jgi:hypothetical protein
MHCPKKPSDDDDRSTANAASSVKKLKKDIKSIQKAFTTVNTQLAQLKEADSDISESEGEEASHFQVDQALQFAQLDKKFATNHGFGHLSCVKLFHFFTKGNYPILSKILESSFEIVLFHSEFLKVRWYFLG